jgi:hypothetical protein
MKKFYISIKKGNDIYKNINKHEFPLNPSTNIVEQAESKVSSLIDYCMVSDTERGDISWKVFSSDGGRFMFVSRSANWVD